MSETKIIDNWLQPLIKQLAPAARRKLARQLAIGLRTRQTQRIAAQQNPDGSTFEPRKPRNRKKTKPRKLFQKIKQTRWLSITADQDGAAVGFTGRVAHIAKIHQQGLLAHVSRGGPLYDYPERQLLGWRDDDIEWVSATIKNHLSE